MQGVKFLSSPQVYIFSVIVAFLLYYFDKQNLFQRAYRRGESLYREARAGIERGCQSSEAFWGWLQGQLPSFEYLCLILGTLSIMLILAIWKSLQIRHRRRQAVLLREHTQQQELLEQQQKAAEG